MKRLREENFQVLGYFYNPNIHPQEEYNEREDVVKQVAAILDFELVPAAYDKDNWLNLTEGLESEPEGSSRCAVCFKIRLAETQKKAEQMNIPHFCTTLTVSPHKNAEVINNIGKQLSDSGFVAHDFKKQEGFKLAMEFSKQYNLYRQDYCGCIYSQKNPQQKC